MSASRYLLAALAASTLTPTLAQACDYYRDTAVRQDVFDLPNAGQGLVVAILPAGSSACIVESTQDGTGATWERVEFYTLDDVKYNNASGWLQVAAEAAPTRKEPVQVVTTTPEVTVTETGSEGSKESFFAASWSLLPAQSYLSVMSIKKGDVAEVHSFSDLTGSIAPDGTASVAVGLESVETGVDIRNVRMRFLFFEIDSYPQATISAKLDPAALDGLWAERRMTMDLPFTLSLRGENLDLNVPVVVSRMGDQTVSVSNTRPVLINVSEFGLTEGLGRLSEAVGNIDITPVVPVNFNLAFVAE